MVDFYPHATPIPTHWIGPVSISGNVIEEESCLIPLATYESPLWASCNRGAKISRLVENGIRVTITREMMTRSILVYTDNAASTFAVLRSIYAQKEILKNVVRDTSRFAQLIDIHDEIVGNLLFLRFSFQTGDAAGHNMVTKAADALLHYLLEHYPQLHYGSVSGNYCTDKKASAVNGILGRGKHAIAEILIPDAICARHLRSSAEKISTLNLQKNLIGSTLAGSIRSANAHFANMLLAFYLATGQDAANIIEGSQGMVHCENRAGDLYFSCTLPNLIIGSVGNGKNADFAVVNDHLEKMGCRAERSTGENARRLAALCAAVVLCGELSLLAAQTNLGELMRAHLVLERKS